MDKNVLENIPGKGVRVMTAAGTLKLEDRHIYAESAAAAFAIKLPNVSEAIGSIISIYFIGSGTDSVTITDFSNESEDATTLEALDLNAVDDGVVLMSNGLKWLIICNDIS